MQTRELELLELPSEVLTYVSSFLNNRSFVNLSETCRFFHRLQESEKNRRINSGLSDDIDGVEKKLLEVEKDNELILGGKLHPAKVDHKHYLLFLETKSKIIDITFSIRLYDAMEGVKINTSTNDKNTALIKKYEEVFKITPLTQKALMLIEGELEKRHNKTKETNERQSWCTVL